MLRHGVAIVLCSLVCVTACGGSSPAPRGPSAAAVSVQPGDLPKGMVKCDLTGDINSFIAKEQQPDPSTARTTSDEWSRAQKNGAKAAYVAIYTDSSANCSAIKTNTSDVAAATYKLVVNFVIQFKDEKSASAAYKSDNAVFGFSAAQLRSGGSAVAEGTSTGLGPTSITLSQPVGNQTFYIAIWQNKTVVALLLALNIDAAAGKKAATAENSRIK
jgi:hypothetical protein